MGTGNIFPPFFLFFLLWFLDHEDYLVVEVKCFFLGGWNGFELGLTLLEQCLYIHKTQRNSRLIDRN